MSDELNKELAALAAKLGVSVEHLWGVLVRQAYIDGLSSLVPLFCCAVAGLGVLWFFFHRRRKYKLTTEPKERFFFSTNEPLEYMVLGTILFILVMVAGNNFYWVISDFFNPEFYALRHLPFPHSKRPRRALERVRRPCPVMIGRQGSPWPPTQMRTILDFSDYERRAIDHGCQERRRHETEF